MEVLNLSAYDDYEYRKEGENEGEGLFSPFTYLCFVLVLFLMGLVTLYSASFDRCIRLGLPHYYMLMHQGIGAIIGIVVGLAVCFLPTRFLRYSHFVLLILFLSIFTSFFIYPELALKYGFSSYFGPLGSVMIILLLSDVMQKIMKSERKGFFLLGTSTVILFLLIVSGLFSGMAWFLLDGLIIAAMLNTNGVKKTNVTYVLLFLLVTFLFLNFYVENLFSTLMNSILPVSDSTFYSRDLYVARMAIRDGGITGVGMGKGLYKLGLIGKPEDEWVFSTLCEETGIFGVFPFLLSYLIIGIVSIRTINRALRKNAIFIGSMVSGMMVFFVFSSLLNVLRAIGSNPFGGILLPLFSFDPILEGVYVAMLCLLYKYIHVIGRRKLGEK